MEILSCLNKDLLFEISKSCFSLDLRNFKLAFPEIDLNQEVYSKSQKLTSDILSQYRNKFPNQVMYLIYKSPYRDYLFRNLRKAEYIESKFHQYFEADLNCQFLDYLLKQNVPTKIYISDIIERFYPDMNTTIIHRNYAEIIDKIFRKRFSYAYQLNALNIRSEVVDRLIVQESERLKLYSLDSYLEIDSSDNSIVINVTDTMFTLIFLMLNKKQREIFLGSINKVICLANLDRNDKIRLRNLKDELKYIKDN